jgi:hypothetical protein
MHGLTDFITTARWSDILTVWFTVVDDAHHTLEQQFGAWRQRGATPHFSDSEVITVALFLDTFFAGHEALGLWFLRQYHADMFPALPSNGVFNERRRLLGHITEQIRRLLTAEWGLINPADQLRLLDSAPISITTWSRGSENASAAGSAFWGVCASKGSKIYGFKLHLLATSEQVVDTWLLVPAAVHDSQVVDAVLEGRQDLDVLADGAFHNPAVLERLRARRNVRVWAPPRKDSRRPWPAAFRQRAGRWRRRVESVIGVLTTVFHVETPHSRTLDGLIARVATRLLAYNLSFITGAQLAKLRP